MKKHFLSILSLVLLVSCGAVSSSSQESQPNPLEGVLENAIAAVQEDFKVTTEVYASREYSNPWFVESNVSSHTRVETKFNSVDNDKNIATTSDFSSVYEGVSTLGQSLSALYEKETNILLDEVLNHRNEREISRQVNYSTSGYKTLDRTSVHYNYFSELKESDFSLSEDGTTATYSGDLFNLYSNAVYRPFTTKSATFTLKDGKFTSFTVEFEPQDSVYVGTSGASAEYLANLKLEGAFQYSGYEVALLSPVATNKVAALDEILAQYVDTSYAVQPINPDQLEEGAMAQVIYDGDKIAVDLCDLMGTYEIDSLSWLDARLMKEEGTDKYYFENLSLDWDTFEYKWVTTEEIAEDLETTVPDKAVSLDIEDFRLDFTNIDTSLFTLKDGSESVYEINPAAAKHFGRCIVPTISDYSSILPATEMHLYLYTVDATSWTVEILEDNSLLFVCSAEYDLTGATMRSSFGFILTGAGTASVDAFYTNDLPSLM